MSNIRVVNEGEHFNVSNGTKKILVSLLQNLLGSSGMLGDFEFKEFELRKEENDSDVIVGNIIDDRFLEIILFPKNEICAYVYHLTIPENYRRSQRIEKFKNFFINAVEGKRDIEKFNLNKKKQKKNSTSFDLQLAISLAQASCCEGDFVDVLHEHGFGDPDDVVQYLEKNNYIIIYPIYSTMIVTKKSLLLLGTQLKGKCFSNISEAVIA